MENEDETLDSTNETEDTVKANEEEVADTESEETEESKPKYTDNEKKLYARMKKAEAEVKLAKEELAKKPSEKPAPVSNLQEIVNATLEKRELEALDLSDELKKEISTYAKIQGVSVKKALKSDYISFLQEKEEKTEKTDNASLGSNRKGTKKDYSDIKASSFDLRTPEGKAAHAEYQEHIRKKLDNN